MTKTFALPYGIFIVRSESGAASIKSDLRQEFLLEDRPETDFTSEDRAAEGFITGIETLLLGLASTGVDLNQPAFARAVEAAVDAYVNHAD